MLGGNSFEDKTGPVMTYTENYSDSKLGASLHSVNLLVSFITPLSEAGGRSPRTAGGEGLVTAISPVHIDKTAYPSRKRVRERKPLVYST